MFSSGKRVEKYREEARQARQDGQALHTTYLYGGAREWAVIIETIESEGWQLREWTVDQSMAYPVFRRAH